MIIEGTQEMLMLFKTDLLLLEGWLPGPRTCREAGSLHSWLHGLCRSACQAFNVSHRSTKDSLSACHLLDMPLGIEMNSMYKGAGGSLSSRVFGHRSTSSAVWLWKDGMRRGESEGEGVARGRRRCWSSLNFFKGFLTNEYLPVEQSRNFFFF